MKRKPRFFIGFLAAAITFGTLMATIGPRHFRHHSRHGGDQKCEQSETKNIENKNIETKNY
jgi:hypothetical protein